jgi:prephenate dehydrogenase
VDDEALYAVDGVQMVTRKDRSVTVMGTGDLAASLISALAADGVQVSGLEARRGNLDDAFIRLTRDTGSVASEEVQA